MAFNLTDFTNALQTQMLSKFPRDDEAYHEKKKHKRHLQDAMQSVIPIGLDGYSFEFGSELDEANDPHYHILEDANVIRKKGRSTTTSRGSQANVSNLAERDYGKWTIRIQKLGGKQRIAMFQEYRKNIRGKRNQALRAQYKTFDANGKKVIMNNKSPYYKNIHYHYIEKAIDLVIPSLCAEFNLKQQRTKIESEFNPFDEHY